MSLLAAGGRRRGGIFAGPLNVVVDGNSIWDNYYTAFGKFDQHLMQYEPLKSSGATHYCGAVSGYNWDGLISKAPAGIDPRWMDGKTNVLIVNETINSVWNAGKTAAQVKASIETYVAGRLALHPWRIILSTCPPAGGSAAYAARNAIRMEVNDWVMTDAAALGVEVVVDASRVPQFDHDGNAPGPFQAYAADWQESTNWLHPRDAPKLLWAELIVGTMETMSA